MFVTSAHAKSNTNCQKAMHHLFVKRLHELAHVYTTVYYLPLCDDGTYYIFRMIDYICGMQMIEYVYVQQSGSGVSHQPLTTKPMKQLPSIDACMPACTCV